MPLFSSLPALRWLLPALLLAAPALTYAQGVGIGTTAPNASAALDIVSSSKGALLPRLTVTQIAAIATPATGLLVFQTDGTPGFYYNAGTPAAPSWQLLATATGAAITASNGLTKTGQNVALGGNLTTPVTILQGGQAFSLTGGNVGIGTATPQSTLDVSGDLRVSTGTTSNTLGTGTAGNATAGTAGLGQSFTLPTAGTITSIRLRSNTTYSTTFTLYSGAGSGGTALAPAQAINFVAGTASTVPLTTPLVLGAGTYTLTLTQGTGIQYYNTGTDAYAGGSLYFGNAMAGGGVDLEFGVGYTSGTATSAFYVGTGGNVGIGTSGTPGQKLDVTGGNIRIGTTGNGLIFPDGTTQTTAATTATGAGFIQNGTTPQASANFNVSGSGTVGGTLAAANAIIANALTGSGANLGSVVGVGIRADGGLNIGQNTPGHSFYLGYQAGQVNTGSNNQFSGYQSGYSNTTGYQNYFSGYQTGVYNTTGIQNQFSGYQSGVYNSTGSQNQFSGNQSGFNNTTGSANVFSGYQSGSSNTTGNANLFVGWQSGVYNTTGSNNTVLGYASGPANGSGGLTNATALGANVTLATSNTLILGNGANVGIGTNAPATQLQVVSADNVMATNILDVQAQNLTAGSALWYNGLRSTGTNANNPLYLDAKGTGDILLNTAGGTGNVGISTNTPHTLLDLGSTGGSSPTDAAAKKLAVYNSAAGDDFYGLGVSPATLHLFASGTSTAAPRMSISGGNGNVGIGTSIPAQRLDVTGGSIQISTAGQGYGLIFPDGTTQTTAATTATGAGFIQNGTAPQAGSNFNISGNGTIGGNETVAGSSTVGTRLSVGTSAPAVAPLNVRGAGNAFPATSGTTQSAGLIGRLQTSNNLVLDMGGNGASGAWLQSTDAVSLSAGYPLLLNPNGGSVGIGTTTPGQALDVAGTVRATNAIIANALTGSGASLGSVVGVGIRADGGLNLGQNNGHSLYLGYQAGQVNTGAENQFIGYQAGLVNTTGTRNVFIGASSGLANVVGKDNVFMGVASGYSTTGSYNVFNGTESGAGTGAGANNTFVGWRSGFNNTTGSNNTVLGYGSGPANGSGNLTNATALGANVSLTQSNTLLLGNGANVGIGIAAPSAALEVQAGPALDGTTTGTTTQLRLGRVGSGNTKWATAVELAVGTYATGVNSQSQLDFKLAQNANATADQTVLTLRGDGRVGIGTTTPSQRLDVTGGSIRISTSGQGLIFPDGSTQTTAPLHVNGATPATAVGTLAAGSSSTVTFAVVGALTTATATLSPQAALGDGILVAQVWVSAAGTVSLRLTNVSAATVAVPATTYNLTLVQ